MIQLNIAFWNSNIGYSATSLPTVLFSLDSLQLTGNKHQAGPGEILPGTQCEPGMEDGETEQAVAARIWAKMLMP